MRTTNFPRFEAVALPEAVFEEGGIEVLRAIIVKGGLHVSMRRAFDQPKDWGMVIADVVRDIARAYAADRKVSERIAIEQICVAFAAEMEIRAAPARAAKVKSKTRSVRNKPKRRSRA